ncbi:uncharacterized protein LOC130625019 [Hydractinia symbiolongicarpus]|uniref:uncharacterized protein LOC130625019 n=1 Tax=Hydractinia symbiolongicarpus TaxID=13093 RepID=UPI00254D9C9A|nr:uncharacterized protein LOC130625019 [Hydractinia symbiolongicarpus]
MKLLFLFSTFCFASVGIKVCSALSCNKCNSAVSWTDCNKQGSSATCYSKDDVCYAVKMVRYDGKAYQMDCTTKELCTKQSLCHGDTTYCKVSCCETDNCCSNGDCNAGGYLKTNVWLLVFFLYLAYILTFQ